MDKDDKRDQISQSADITVKNTLEGMRIINVLNILETPQLNIILMNLIIKGCLI